METSVVHLTIPEAFRVLCRESGIEEQKALQHYINHLNIFVLFTEKEVDCPFSMAGHIFSATNRLQGGDVISVNRDLHVAHVKQVFSLVYCKLAPAERQVAYRDIIDRWHFNLQ